MENNILHIAYVRVYLEYGYVSGEAESYQVKIKQLVNDDRVWRIIKNGYPYKSLNELGVETIDDAYFATMQAVNCVLRGYTLDQAKGLYTAGQFSINGESYEDIQRRGNKTLKAMFNLIDIGLNGKETRSALLSITAEKATEFKKENDQFYSQTFKIKSSSEITSYFIEKIEGMPEDCYISDISGNKKVEFKQGENFKIMIPKNSITKDINGKITIKAKQKNYPLYYGESLLEGFQDYALCNDEYSDVYTNCEIHVDSNKSKLIIKKVDTETNKELEGVKFEITNSEGIKNTYITDKNGKIELSNLKQGKIIIKEVAALENYKLMEDEINVNLTYDETKEIEICNELKKGNIKVVKVDKDNEKLKLANVKFALKDENDNLIEEKVTDENGIIEFNNIPIGNYKLIEVETCKEYELNKDVVEAVVKYNKTNEIVIKNKKIEIPKEVQKTEKTEKIEKTEVIEKQEQLKIIEKEIVQPKIIKKELPKTGEKSYIKESILLLVSSTIFLYIKKIN